MFAESMYLYHLQNRHSIYVEIQRDNIVIVWNKLMFRQILMLN